MKNNNQTGTAEQNDSQVDILNKMRLEANQNRENEKRQVSVFTQTLRQIHASLRLLARKVTLLNQNLETLEDNYFLEIEIISKKKDTQQLITMKLAEESEISAKLYTLTGSKKYMW